MKQWSYNRWRLPKSASLQFSTHSRTTFTSLHCPIWMLALTAWVSLQDIPFFTRSRTFLHVSGDLPAACFDHCSVLRAFAAPPAVQNSVGFPVSAYDRYSPGPVAGSSIEPNTQPNHNSHFLLPLSVFFFIFSFFRFQQTSVWPTSESSARLYSGVIDVFDIWIWWSLFRESDQGQFSLSLDAERSPGSAGHPNQSGGNAAFWLVRAEQWRHVQRLWLARLAGSASKLHRRIVNRTGDTILGQHFENVRTSSCHLSGVFGLGDLVQFRAKCSLYRWNCAGNNLNVPFCRIPCGYKGNNRVRNAPEIEFMGNLSRLEVINEWALNQWRVWRKVSTMLFCSFVLVVVK